MSNAVVAGLFFKGRQILLAKRLSTPFKDYYCLPGGKVDFGEPLQAAMKREILEETSCVVKDMSLYYVGDDIGEGHHYVCVFYRIRSWEYEPKNLEPHKHGPWEWHDLCNLPQPLLPAFNQMLKELFGAGVPRINVLG